MSLEPFFFSEPFWILQRLFEPNSTASWEHSNRPNQMQTQADAETKELTTIWGKIAADPRYFSVRGLDKRCGLFLKERCATARRLGG